MKRLPLHVKIILGLVAGIIWALIASSLGLAEFTVDWIGPFGTIFIKVLKLIAVPLVLFSIISGVTGLSDVSRLGGLGFKTLITYLLTTASAVTVGLLLVNTINPGKLVNDEQRIVNRMRYELWALDNDKKKKDDRDYLGNEEYQEYEERARSLYQTDVVDEETSAKIETAEKTKDASPLAPLLEMVPSNIFGSLSDNSSMLQVIFFAIFFGITLIMLPNEKVAPIINFVGAANEVFLKMVDIVMKGAPFFVFALLAGKMCEMAGNNPEQLLQIFKGLGWYALTVVVGLAFMAYIFYPLIMKALSKGIGFKEFLKGIAPAQMLAFSTSSSAATLPVTMDCVRDNLGVKEDVTSFVLPIGATVNMDGTSLYQAVAVVFLAQFHMVDLSIAQQLTIILTATLASIGSAAVPSAGLIMLIIVLESVGLNPAWIAIIFPVDRILDMCRTVVNVTGDATVSTVINEFDSKSVKA